MKYYVYAYLRHDGSPYYIGKGSRNRAWDKGKHEIGKPTNIERIVIIERHLTLTGSLAIERRLIRWYGRKDLGTGILRNQTNGGDGGKGAEKGNKLSDATKKKISQSRIGKRREPMTEESKRRLSESMKGKNIGKERTEEQRVAQSSKQKGITRKPHTEKTKAKLREANLGKNRGPLTDEHKNKISQSNKGIPKSRDAVEKQRAKVKDRIPSEGERQNYLAAMSITYKCEHCGKETTKGNYLRWHHDQCRSK